MMTENKKLTKATTLTFLIITAAIVVGSINACTPFAPVCNCSNAHNLTNESPLYFGQWRDYSFILALEDQDIICLTPVGTPDARVCMTAQDTYNTYCVGAQQFLEQK